MTNNENYNMTLPEAIAFLNELFENPFMPEAYREKLDEIANCLHDLAVIVMAIEKNKEDIYKLSISQIWKKVIKKTKPLTSSAKK